MIAGLSPLPACGVGKGWMGAEILEGRPQIRRSMMRSKVSPKVKGEVFGSRALELLKVSIPGYSYNFHQIIMRGSDFYINCLSNYKWLYS